MQTDTETPQNFEKRKKDHVALALNDTHQAQGLGGFERVHLTHDAMPELNFESIRLESTRLGKPSPTPFFISGMTAGHSQAFEINTRLAEACTRQGWALGLGSQRRELEEGSTAWDRWEDFRREFPDLILYANIGISQVIGKDLSRIKTLIEAVRAQALVVHLNALQEALQPEGTPFFAGGCDALAKVGDSLDVPVVLKETGCGFSAKTLARINGISIQALDVSGLGGTHWGRIEGSRALARGSRIRSQAAEIFANWGESTVDSVLAAKSTLSSSVEVWGSGGVRSGLDAAKLLALGAVQVGFAQPALQEALKGTRQEGVESLIQWMEQIEFELKVAMFCTGTATINELVGNSTKWKLRQL